MSQGANTAIECLAKWASGLTASATPAAVRVSALRFLLDTVGVTIAGSQTGVARLARSIESGGASQQLYASGLGTVQRFDARAAAFVNGTAAHALDFDDNCYAGFVHGSAVIVPAALAVAQEQDATGEALITALIAGAECEYAMGAASENALYDQGWWTTGVLGPIGASVAAAHLLRLSSAQTAAALGLAVVGAGGMKACFGTDAKPLMAGRASESGVVCARLAAQGATGPLDAFEANNGFVKLFNNGQFDASVLDRLGSRWSITTPGIDIKRIPVCLSSHAAVDAVMALQAQHGFKTADIVSIVCDVPPIVRKNLVYERPTTIQQAQFSLEYVIAASLRFGNFGLEHLSLALIQDEGLRPLLSLVSMRTSDRWDSVELCRSAPEGAQVTISLRDGRRYEAFRANAHGSALDPLSDAELEDKFLACTVPCLQDAPARSLLASVKAIDSTTPLRSVF